MKIALACDWFLPRVGGIETHLRDLAVRLRARGHDVHVITPTPGDPVVDGIPVHRVPALLVPHFGFACNAGAFRAMADILARERFDVVHAHASIVSPAAYGSAILSLRRGTPTVVSFHSVLRNHAWWLRPALRGLRLPARGANLTAVSGIVAREAAALLNADHVGVLPNAIEPDDWIAARRPRMPNELLLVSVMRLTPKKRPRALLRMIARLRRAVPAVSFRTTIVGDGRERAPMERLVRRLQLDGVVELAGTLARDRIRALYAIADVFVLPTTLESFGIAPLEARAAGLPVVLMRQAGVVELLTDGVDGLFADSDEGMVECLSRLMTDDALRRGIAEHNRVTPAPACWTDVVAQHEETYRRARGRRGYLS